MNITTRLRETVRNGISLEDLLPDRMPAFVRSPAYFFGVLCLSSLVLLIVSGIILAAFGPQWWHTNDVGHFMNSLHFWSAEAFFFTMALHLWTSFFLAAWRHGRRLTWVTGMLLFLASITTALTGYLSMTNFAGQWIGVQGKDALNSVGVGAFFNLLNFGQMYGFHIVIFPTVIVMLVGIHLLLVRMRGVVRPYAATLKEEKIREAFWSRRGRKRSGTLASERDSNVYDQTLYYRGVRMMSYDLIREGLIALLVIFVLVIVLAGLLSSPDEAPLTLQQYAQQNPVGFVTTSMGELSGAGTTAQYGPPYNDGSGATQFIGPISLQQAAGVTIPVDVAHVFVLDPLAQASQSDPDAEIASALRTYNNASAKQQASWGDAYTTALGKATANNNHLVLPKGDYGPLPTMMDHLLTLANSGVLDGLLLHSKGFFQNDFTKPLLFLSEDALPAKAQQYHLLGPQWGIMNETANYPGQSWLWMYTLWYQIPPYNTSSNADVLALLTTGILSTLLILFPFLPLLNRLPYYLGVHRLIWRDYYHDVRELRKREVGLETPDDPVLKNLIQTL